MRPSRQKSEHVIGDWILEEPFREKVRIEGLDICLSGLHAKHSKLGEVTGSAAKIGQFPDSRAYYELMERIAILESMRRERFFLRAPANAQSVGEVGREAIFPPALASTYQFARSNGVALHTTWEEACRRACFEMVERHCVLASWVGATKPKVRADAVAGSALNRLWPIYDVLRISFGSQAVSCFEVPVCVSGIALMPKQTKAPLILAFGAALNPQESAQKAEGEALQRLGFLWGEEIPETLPELTPNNLYHQELFLHTDMRSLLEDWLSGKFPAQKAGWPERLDIRFADLSFAGSELCVAKALCPEAIPLVFGLWREREFAGLPETRLIHPIA